MWSKLIYLFWGTKLIAIFFFARKKIKNVNNHSLTAAHIIEQHDFANYSDLIFKQWYAELLQHLVIKYIPDNSPKCIIWKIDTLYFFYNVSKRKFLYKEKTNQLINQEVN